MICGKVWKFGDNIDTDIIIPARYLVMPIDDMKHKAMEPLDPRFAARVKKGDLIVAGKNFGCGSSREQAPLVLKKLGIGAIIAAGFARIFFRNAINIGIPVIECSEIYNHIADGETIQVDPASGEIVILETNKKFNGSTLPDFLLEVVNAGGLISYLSSR